jgi:hypothetical protein
MPVVADWLIFCRDCYGDVFFWKVLLTYRQVSLHFGMTSDQMQTEPVFSCRITYLAMEYSLLMKFSPFYTLACSGDSDKKGPSNDSPKLETL